MASTVIRGLRGITNATCGLERDLRAAQERIAQLTAPGEHGDLPSRLRQLASRISGSLPLMSIPVNKERDGDCLADEAATAIEQLQARVRELEWHFDDAMKQGAEWRERAARRKDGA